MVLVGSTRQRTTALDNDMERARRELAELERLEAEDVLRKQAEMHHWYAGKWEKFKPALTAFLDLFPLIRQVDDDWRRDVFCGRVEFDEQVGQVVRGIYALWLIYIRMFKEKAEYIGRNLPCAPDEFLDRLGKYAREGDRILRAWEPPVISKGPSFRAPVLSLEAAARFKEMFPDTK